MIWLIYSCNGLHTIFSLRCSSVESSELDLSTSFSDSFKCICLLGKKKKNTCKPTTYWEKWYSIYKQQNLRVWVTCCTAVPFSFPYITTLKFQVVYKGNRIFIHQQQTSQQFRNPFLTDDWDKHVVSGRNFEIDTKLIFGIISRNRKIFLWGVRGLRGKKKQKHEEIHNLIQALLLSYFPLFKL